MVEMRNTTSTRNAKKRILFALLTDYYLFNYSRDLVNQLVRDDFIVTILAHDVNVAARINEYGLDVTVICLPSPIRWAANRSGNALMRFALWLGIKYWVYKQKNNFDFAIVPWDYRVIWHQISKAITSLTIHNTTDFIDIELKLERSYLSRIESESFKHKFWLAIDNIFGGKLLPRANGRILKYGKSWLIDRLCGYRGPNGHQGFSGIRYLTVTGDQVRRNYQSLGVGVYPNPTEIVVTGSPNYEFLNNTKLQKLDETTLLKKLGIPSSGFRLFTFFLSPSSFTNVQVQEIVEVVSTLAKSRLDIWFVLKFHPKTRQGDPEKIRKALDCVDDRLTIITAVTGDEWNATLIRASSCLVQKQSTVGFIAMAMEVPIISYNLRETNYDDDMYKILGGSFHSESVEQLLDNLQLIECEEGRRELRERQRRSMSQFCKIEGSACARISCVIKEHFS